MNWRMFFRGRNALLGTVFIVNTAVAQHVDLSRQQHTPPGWNSNPSVIGQFINPSFPAGLNSAAALSFSTQLSVSNEKKPDDSLNSPSDINYGRLAIVGGTMVGGMVGIHIYQQNGWWKNNRAPFHFQEDLQYGLWVDKIGHFYGATLMAFVATKAFEWSNLSEEHSRWLGSGLSFLFETYIEIEDGFSAWGFDRVDFATNVAGAAWPIARSYVPFLTNLDFKFSYHPSPLLHNPGGVGFQGQQHLIFDDYEGQTMWLSAKVDNLVPEPIGQYWPDFLCIALGYGARDIAGPDPYPVFLLALDYDLTRIIPQHTWFLKSLSEALNFIHLPAPAVRISPSAIWYGLYF